MFSKFSAASRRVLRAAEQECRNHNHYYVGAEHMLLALLEEQDRDVMLTLLEDDIDIGDIHGDVRRALGTGEDRMWEGILVTPRVRKIVELAQVRAGDADIEPLHLYQAIREEGGSIAAELLSQAAKRSTAAVSE